MTAENEKKLNWSKITIDFQNIELTSDDIKRYCKNVEVLIISGAFETAGSRIYLDFDNQKNLMQIKRVEEYLWKRTKND